VSGIESSLHDFFSCLSIFISYLVFLERAIAYCLLIASFVAWSLSWTLSDDQLSCKISAFSCAMKCSRVKTLHCAKWHKLSVYMLGFTCTSLLVGWGIPHILHGLVSWTWDEITHPFYSDLNTHYCSIRNLSFFKPFLLMVLLSVFLLSSRNLLNALHRGSGVL